MPVSVKLFFVIVLLYFNGSTCFTVSLFSLLFSFTTIFGFFTITVLSISDVLPLVSDTLYFTLYSPTLVLSILFSDSILSVISLS